MGENDKYTSPDWAEMGSTINMRGKGSAASQDSNENRSSNCARNNTGITVCQLPNIVSLKIAQYAHLKSRNTTNIDIIISKPIPMCKDINRKKFRPIIMFTERNAEFKGVATIGTIVGGLEEVIWRKASSVGEDFEQEK